MEGYRLGVDLGTTFTAAAVHRGGRAEIVDLGTRTSAVPSAVFLGPDGRMVVGEAAQRRALGEPDRVAREFKRRFGDPVPVMIAGSPMSADVLTATLLTWVLDAVVEREGAAPAAAAVTHPANWGPYKRDLLQQVVRLAGFDEALLLTEPEAAARSYLAGARLDVGQALAVYDLGGGTFDAAVLRRTDSGLELLGTPEGVERLGGVDLDEAVVGHVQRSVPELGELDPSDPSTAAALTRLRAECVAAKEALSADTETVIPVAVGGIATEVRLTRAEFEDLVRPTLIPTLDVLERVIASADLESADLATVLLVGGSSRVPLVSVLVSQRLGRPVAVDAHPKNAVALGAAAAAGGAAPRVAAAPALPARPAPVAAPRPVRAPTEDRFGTPSDRPAVPARRPGPPAATPAPRRAWWPLAATVLAVLTVIAAVVVAPAAWQRLAGVTEPGEVFLEAAAAPGVDPFTGDLVTGSRPVVPGRVPPGAGPGTPALPGDQPALYGGTRNEGSCDKAGLVAFLLAHPEQGAAWSAVQGIAPAEVPRFVGGLTPVLLRADTRVTNHGYRDGRATPRQSVLQAGTAVLVDRLGRPRVKCGCGNPLLDPVASTAAFAFRGTAWKGFSADSLLVVAPARVAVVEFVVHDVRSGGTFLRPRGTSGEADVPAAVPDVTSTGPPPPPPPGSTAPRGDPLPEPRREPSPPVRTPDPQAPPEPGPEPEPEPEPEPAHTVTVDARSGWQDTPLQLSGGERFSVTYVSGTWTVDERNHPRVGPDGYSAEADASIYQPCKLGPDLPYAMLLTSLGDGFDVIGSGGTRTAPHSGRLRLRIHDGCLEDNAGSVTVRVRLEP